MAASGKAPKKSKSDKAKAQSYRHPEADSPLRPEIGTQPKFKKKKPPVTYRYDSSLSPALEWDGQNGARDLADFLVGCIKDAAKLPGPQVFDAPRELTLNDGTARATVRGLEDAVDQLAALGKPFLNWAGKAERLSFDVPTLPLFVHERLSTAAIIDTLKSHRKPADVQLDLFGDPQHPISDQLLRAYEYRDKWVNRMILGDSLVVMSSLLHYEGLAGQVQTIYMDPPYGVKFGSNFQPFVRKRDVKHNDDDDMTREPEMVKAYRDTWELGLHSYLTYMRDRLLLARELLTPSGSIFVQISDENLHHVRELMDEVFGQENFCSLITFVKTSAVSSPLARTEVLGTLADYLVWYAKDIGHVKYRQLYDAKIGGEGGEYSRIEFPDGTRRPMIREELRQPEKLPAGYRLYRQDNIISTGFSETLSKAFEFEGTTYSPGSTAHWKTTLKGMERLTQARRLEPRGKQLAYVRYLVDFPVTPLANVWNDVMLRNRN